MLFGLAVLGLSALTGALELPSFAPADLPLSTKDNDGTIGGRYDVRPTMAITQDPFQPGLNSWFYLVWLTTVDGRKYHLTINTVLRGASELGYNVSAFQGLQDLSDLTTTGGVILESGTSSKDHLNIHAPSQNLTTVQGSDNYTDVHYSGDFAGFALDLDFQPTGRNFYYGGSGGYTLAPVRPSDLFTVPPGYSWYWGNPHLRVSGSIKVDGQDVQIDSTQSTGFFERQWGVMQLRNWYLHWLYLSNGVVLHIWINEPSTTGAPTSDSIAVASVWYPNGASEVLPVDDTTSAWDAVRDPESGYLYFSEYRIDLLQAKNASLHVTRHGGLDAVLKPLGNISGMLNVSEAYAQGDGTWNGEQVQIWGHVEQISTLV
ncbi:mucin-1 (muc-1) protein [Diplodia corticola]|uniref:Mucin-1 (Muc-1) protein n=1 Tax=Diplodia corticola TaxID=236234 RepID=A0A1J9QPQ0_9PEZI|nr:mucin-1 (muc-1) protein [Diplodia corticola]OJD30432.1 mucin-1 (muc-1) protein [Diplodia corticola]